MAVPGAGSSWRLPRLALLGLQRGAFLRLLEPVRFSIEGDDLGVMHQTVYQRHDTSGIWKHFDPTGKGFVGGNNGALRFVAAADQFEQQVRMAVGVGQVTDLVNYQQCWTGVEIKAAAQSRVAVERGHVAQQLAGADE